jgi:hypothetical protein
MRLWRDREVSYPKGRIANRSPVICQSYVIRIMVLNVGKRPMFEKYLCFSINASWSFLRTLPGGMYSGTRCPSAWR